MPTYILLLTKTDKHEVSPVLKDLPQGEAKEGWKRLHDHFNRQTHGGREEAENNFNNASMASTHTNIMQWLALVVANGKALKAVSPGFDETRVLTKLLAGLLHEFDNVKTNLEVQDGLTLIQAKKRLIDYAATRKLTNLTKGGPRRAPNNTFNVADNGGKGNGRGRGGRGRGRGGKGAPTTKPQRPRVPRPDQNCNLLENGGECRFGPDKCLYNHPGVDQPWHRNYVAEPAVNVVDDQEAVVASYSFTTEALDDVSLGVVDDDADQETQWNPKSIGDMVPIGQYGFTGDIDKDRDRIGRMQAYQQNASPDAELD
jgi:hypothetical protein